MFGGKFLFLFGNSGAVKTAEAVGGAKAVHCRGLKPPAMDSADLPNGFNRFPVLFVSGNAH